MKITSTIQMSLISMASNKTRTFLTILGIVIGVASVIVVFSAGEGIKGLLYSQIETFGTDIIETEVKVPTGKKGQESEMQSAQSQAMGVQVTSLKIKDMEDVSKLSNVKSAYAGIMDQEQVSFENEMKRYIILGVSGTYLNIDKSEVEYGRFYTEEEDKSLAQVVVIGPKIKEKFFGDEDPLGKFIKIRKTKFAVVGVLKSKGAVMGMDFDSMIYVPIRTLQKKVMGVEHIQYMVHQLKDLSQADDTAEEARLIIRENHNIESVRIENKTGIKVLGEGDTDTSKDDFRVVTMQESMEILDTVMGATTYLLLAIVIISLIVGGVGIMNIMYVAVTERTPEIGLRKAVGAKYNDVMTQFLIEAVLITMLGGIVGILFGILLSFLVYLGANHYGFNWKFLIPTRSIVISLGFSAFFGLVFGVYPAKKAARLNPIEALRVE